MQQQSIGSKLFVFEGSDETGGPVYTPVPQVQQVCQVVDGFIYVANAEPGRGQRKLDSLLLISCLALSTKQTIKVFKKYFLTVGDSASEAGHIRAVLSSGRGTPSRPLLVLSCISREELDTARTASTQNVTRNQPRHRTPCVDMAKRLELPRMTNPWMVCVLSSRIS